MRNPGPVVIRGVEMLFAIDVGNTNIVWECLRTGFRLTVGVSLLIAKTADEYGMLIRQLFHHNGLSAATLMEL